MQVCLLLSPPFLPPHDPQMTQRGPPPSMALERGEPQHPLMFHTASPPYHEKDVVVIAPSPEPSTFLTNTFFSHQAGSSPYPL